ncbi:MAG: hypothetical protein GY782_11795 [Gammaproteobacteria bacterium]|nr:hypothetical protein [Gammaproteobacteria bacterium]
MVQTMLALMNLIFFPVNGTGGSMTEQLTINQMPNHTHANGNYTSRGLKLRGIFNTDFHRPFNRNNLAQPNSTQFMKQ